MGDFSPPEKTSFVLYEVFDDIYEYPLAGSDWFFILITILYLWFVLKIGPDYMKNRPPFQLNKIIVAYNILQVILSLYYVVLAVEIMWISGVLPKVCIIGDPKIKSKVSYFIYIYALGKITELLDTIFFILRKKDNQVTFLHIYHHSSVIYGTFAVFKYSQNHSVVYCSFINSLVHVVMYFYYGVSAMGPWTAPYLTWKKHITNFQRVQFISMNAHMIVSLFYTTCTYSIIGVIYVFYSASFFFILFTNFYLQSYKKKATKPKAESVTANTNDETKVQ